MSSSGKPNRNFALATCAVRVLQVLYLDTSKPERQPIQQIADLIRRIYREQYDRITLERAVEALRRSGRIRCFNEIRSTMYQINEHGIDTLKKIAPKDLPHAHVLERRTR